VLIIDERFNPGGEKKEEARQVAKRFNPMYKNELA
jgi:hypothetical protein